MANKPYQRPARTRPVMAGDITPAAQNNPKKAAEIAKDLKLPKMGSIGLRRQPSFRK